ncbi:hypothetical protein OL239_19070 [Arthrobacter sp. ATA002]|nr:hypothetical protein [Arthrobacter sp. ATA002]WAP51797.1 hypothetical protein OL239_19070 [Arthrobacter sp. ATA002]
MRVRAELDQDSQATLSGPEGSDVRLEAGVFGFQMRYQSRFEVFCIDPRQQPDQQPTAEARREELLDELDPGNGSFSIDAVSGNTPVRHEEVLFLVVAQRPCAHSGPLCQLSYTHPSGFLWWRFALHVDVNF